MDYEITDTSNERSLAFTITTSKSVFRVSYNNKDKEVILYNYLDPAARTSCVPVDIAIALHETIYRLMSKVKKPHYLLAFKDDLDIALNDLGVKIAESQHLNPDILDKYQTACNLIEEIRKGLE